ncbi:MAG: hypothetical protein KKH28_04050, partial [Elusimicrobia bacterium]|nr:hypothetical protein [Elusimicrobiota bacterium]
IKPEALREIKPEALREIKPEALREIKPEALREIKPEARQEIKPEARQEIKPEQAAVQGTKQEIKKAPESKPLKSIRPSHAVGLERTLDSDSAGEKDERKLTSRKLMSLGHSQLQSFGPDDFKAEETHGGESPSQPAYPAPAPQESLEPLPQQASGIVYDFTVVTKAAPESEKVQFKIETKAESAPVPASQAPVPGPHPFRQTTGGQASLSPQPSPAAPAQAPAFQQTLRKPGEAPASPFLQTQPAWLGGQSAPGPRPAPAGAPQPSRQTTGGQAVPSPSAGDGPAKVSGGQPSALSPSPEAQEAPAGAGKSVPLADKTERIPVPSQKQKEEAKKPPPDVKKSRSKMVFLVTLGVFGSIAAGGLGYFFLGEGGLSEFSMLNFSGAKKSKQASFSTQVDPKGETAAEPETNASGVSPAKPAPDNAAVPAAPKPAVESASNENTRKALETVKNYKLSGGRGTVSNWFANSFLSNSARGLNEEWSATVLHGDIFVVQYRLLKPKQDPLIYQFEVDVAKAVIVRGINNNAIELLDFSSKATARADTVRKPRSAPKRQPKTRSQLPLPDAPRTRQAIHEEPSGFENPSPEENEKVRYIMAQESDEELF